MSELPLDKDQTAKLECPKKAHGLDAAGTGPMPDFISLRLGGSRSSAAVTPPKTIRVGIADDHPLVQESVAYFLRREQDLEVCFTCGTADEAFELARQQAPAVLLADIAMPGTSVFQTARELSRLGHPCRYLFLSAYLTDAYLQEALDLATTGRPCGYLLKSSPPTDLAPAVRALMAGQSVFTEQAAERLRLANLLAACPEVSPLHVLTPRERQVLTLVASDLSCKEIAAQLGLSVRTVDRHKCNIMSKLDIHSQVGLARYAYAEGLCDPRMSS